VRSTFEVESPCVNICLIEEGYCIGCGRTEDQIMEWLYADDDRKLEILDEISERVKNGEIELYMS
tara:strand:- start:396 stop:590 length:195 start_codon:yes stop_codon:yes gene_type:complete